LGFKWLKPSRTSKDCELRGYGCKERIYDFSFTTNSIVTHKDVNNCESAGGTYGPLESWTPGVWVEYVVKPLLWLPRRWRPIVHYRPTFDFYSFDLFMAETIDKKYAFQIKSEAQCRYHSIGEVLAALACDCTDTGTRQESCFEPNYLLNKLNINPGSVDVTKMITADSVAIATICPGQNKSIEVRKQPSSVERVSNSHEQAPPATLTPLSNSIPGYDCLTIYVDTATAILYKEKEPVRDFFTSHQNPTCLSFSRDCHRIC